ncbi:Hypothetical protein LUCI_2324 [Lucifera butyrica]|uniref:Uncharacterized protein n=1 Tax=Lucifera butyrica TaxID=1351585 RepID=A0A498R836_9FIRM|nr:metallophosphoesterase family protein [Lucifera butyrica]VBB07080.1 Hypothetical protein LUCI_2324 [Lucifera butyrica]
MYRKWLTFMTGAVLMIALAAAPLASAAARTYDQTAIDIHLNATTMPEHVALTWSADPETTMTVTWRTSTAVNDCKIEYKEENGAVNTMTIKPHLFQTAATDLNYGRMNLFTVTLHNLKPGTKYLYRIGNDQNEWTGYSSFTTEDTATVTDNQFKFLVFGDSQSGNYEVPNYNPWHVTLENAYKANPDAKFFINVGDLVEKGQYYQHWNNWFAAAQGVVDRIPAMVVQGNHETYDAADWNSTKPQYFVQQFPVFQNGPDGLKGQTYSYNYGKVHFVVLDSQGEEESEDAQGNVDQAKEEAMFLKQADWLRNDLEQNKDAVFTFVLFHKTPYYNKGTRSNILLKKIFTPIFDQYHVDVVFNGHDHGTSRTYPIYHDEFMQSPSQGTVYYVTGRSGAKYYPDLTQKVWDAKFYDPQDQPDYQTVDVDGRKVTIKAFKQDGTLVDTYVIDKAHPENSTSNHEILPSRYNTKQEVPAIGDSVKLVIFGNMAYGSSSKATIQNGKAYADIQTIAAYTGGSYDAAGKTLRIGHKKYQFTDNMLTDKGTKVDIDALNAMGWSNHYDKKFNMVFVDLQL